MAPIYHTADSCGVFPFSNDRWTPQSVADLNDAFGKSRVPRENGAALVIGAGSLPYTLDRLPPFVISADLVGSVVEGIRSRASSLANLSAWREYTSQFPQESQGAIEARRAIATGLPGPFAEVKAAAARAKIVPFVGDIVVRSTELGTILRDAGRTLTFVNFTNIADYLRSPQMEIGLQEPTSPGHAILAKMLNEWPVDSNAVIIDSTVGLVPRVYTPQTYIEAFEPI